MAETKHMNFLANSQQNRDVSIVLETNYFAKYASESVCRAPNLYNHNFAWKVFSFCVPLCLCTRCVAQNYVS